jgi:hypothetical protein
MASSTGFVIESLAISRLALQRKQITKTISAEINDQTHNLRVLLRPATLPDAVGLANRVTSA